MILRFSFVLAMFVSFSMLHAQNDTFHVYFNLGDSNLTENSKRNIFQLISNNQITRNSNLMILGYADDLGTSAFNFKLSKSRAQTVKRFLIVSGINDNDIRICIGKGKIERDITQENGRPDDRKVQIIATKLRRDSQRTINTNQFEITGLSEGDVIPLNRIFFNFGTAEPTDSSYFELASLAVFLKNNPRVRIQIEGHLCCGGWKSFGKRDLDTGEGSMSAKRAKTVYDFLVINGIHKTRLKYIGLGITRPFVTPEKSPADEALNRRVAIRILSR